MKQHYVDKDICFCEIKILDWSEFVKEGDYVSSKGVHFDEDVISQDEYSKLKNSNMFVSIKDNLLLKLFLVYKHPSCCSGCLKMCLEVKNVEEKILSRLSKETLFKIFEVTGTTFDKNWVFSNVHEIKDWGLQVNENFYKRHCK